MKEHGKYATCSFEDFLQDDFFIESIKQPTADTVAFWNHFLEVYPEQSDTYHAAHTFIEDLVRPQLSDETVIDMWATIQTKVKLSGKRQLKRSIVYASLAVAAGIALLMIARLFMFPPEDHPNDDDIMSFVVNQESAPISGEKVQLILSEQKTVLFEEKESVITYDSVLLHTHNEEISKNELASFNQLIVPYGKSSILTLSDGTKIWVNAGSRLVYPVEFEKDKREIYVNGEIFLDVMYDDKRPFTVRTDDLCIQVVGTKFNVQAYTSDENSRIALESGLVRILSETADDVLLNPNKVYEREKNGLSTVKDANIMKYTSWIYGLYIYESERLDVILKRLERYYGIVIEIDPAVSTLRCSGKLDLKENLEDVLSVISHTAPVDYIQESEKYVVSYKP